MLTIEATEQIAPFLARKQAQWERFAGRIPGLGLVRSGQYGTSLMIYCSTETFYEATVIGQLAQRVPHVVGRGISRRIIDTPDRQKTVDKRGIDMTDGMIEEVLGRWAKEQTALDLDFVPGVWGRDGRLRTA